MPNDRLIAAMQAIREMPTVPVRGGKNYTMVKDRIEIFRQEFGDEFGIETTMDYSQGFADGAPVIAHSIITDLNNHIVASGWAVEFVGSTQITDASPVEVAETSAIGRALACFGLHGGEYASLNEIEAAMRKQDFRQGNGPDERRMVNQRYDGPPDNRQQGYRQPDNFRQADPAAFNRQAAPERIQQGFYVPTDHDAVWLQPEVESNRIIEQIEAIDSSYVLSRYWSELRPAIDIFKTNQLGLDLIAEIKAAFATRHNALGDAR